MQRQRQTVKLLISGRYSRASSLTNRQQHSNQQNLQVERESTQIDGLPKQQIKQILKQKYRTFMSWNFKDSLPRSPKKLVHLSKLKQKQVNNDSSHLLNFSALAKTSTNIKSKNKPQKKSNNSDEEQILKQVKQHKKQQKKPQFISPQMLAVKLARRQRFQKFPNPTAFLKHYIQKQNYIPTVEQKHLISKLVHVQKSMQQQLSTFQQKSPNLQSILQKIYGLMNLSVDYNELLFLALLTCLAADICYYLKDFPRSFYFYNQARIAGSYSHLDKLKIPALMGMAKICFQLQQLDEAKRIFRKGLQYAWRAGDENTELQIYDWYGQIYGQEGRMRDSLFYHQKFAKNQIEAQNSALKKISKAMLLDYDKHIQSLQSSNLDALFLEYIHLPINKAYQIKSKVNPNKVFSNYDDSGKSPRLNKQAYDFAEQSFIDTIQQIQNFITKDYQFQTEIPDPDKPMSRQINRKQRVRHNSDNPFDTGYKKKQIQFEHSIQFNKIIKRKYVKPNIQKQLKLPLDQQVQHTMRQKIDPQWYQHIVSDIKKKRMQKVGSLKQKIRNSHLSYHKYPLQRKKNAMWSSQKINQCFNRTLLDWIDPVK